MTVARRRKFVLLTNKELSTGSKVTFDPFSLYSESTRILYYEINLELYTEHHGFPEWTQTGHSCLQQTQLYEKHTMQKKNYYKEKSASSL